MENMKNLMERLHIQAAETVCNPLSGEVDDYDTFLGGVAETVKGLTTNTETPLFMTDVEDLFGVFMIALKDHAGIYACNACRTFIDRFGSIVTIDEQGNAVSLFWHPEEVPCFFEDAVRAMKQAVEAAPVRGIFLAENKVLGIPKTGAWTHISATLPESMLYRNRLKTAEQKMAELLEDHRLLCEGVETYTMDTIQKAIRLLNNDNAFRGNAMIPQVEWLQRVMQHVGSAKTQVQKDNLIWVETAKAPEGLHVSSMMAHTILDDIAAGMSNELVAARFSRKMTTYQVISHESTEGELENAEKVIGELGIEKSLYRAYAKEADIDPADMVFHDGACAAEKAQAEAKAVRRMASVFAHVPTAQKPEKKQALPNDLPTEKKTWSNFCRTVLPYAVKIEAKADDLSHLAALIGPQFAEAENLFSYGSAYSIDFIGGRTNSAMKEMKARVEAAGGRYEDVDMRVSLMWDNQRANSSRGTDLDLHAYLPNGTHCYYGNRMGILDTDANAAGKKTMDTPVENMRWIRMSGNGHYIFKVHNFSQQDPSMNDFTAELYVKGEVHTIHMTAGRTGWDSKIFEFDLVNGEMKNLQVYGEEGSVALPEAWGIKRGEFVRVKSIVTSPNLWGKAPNPKFGTTLLFLLDGCVPDGQSMGFHKEYLRSEFHTIANALANYAKYTPIANAEGADACGLGYSDLNNEWGLTLRVIMKDGSRECFLIDRFD